MSKTLHWFWSGFGPTVVGPKHMLHSTMMDIVCRDERQKTTRQDSNWSIHRCAHLFLRIRVFVLHGTILLKKSLARSLRLTSFHPSFHPPWYNPPQKILKYPPLQLQHCHCHSDRITNDGSSDNCHSDLDLLRDVSVPRSARH